MAVQEEQKGLVVPEHIAIILDGNGRWAKMRNMPRNYGHTQGSKNVETICKEAYQMGVKYLTVYAFSTENWRRPKEEVDLLMKLLKSYLKDCVKISTKNDMRVRILGDIFALPVDMQESIRTLEEASKNNKGLQFQVALNYGGRDELLRAMKKAAAYCEKEGRKMEELTEEQFAQFLDTAGIPDPDLLIRTSGEQRTSNFLPWQLAYSEMYFPEVLWPDFDKEALLDAIRYYNTRERRFGGIK